MTNALYYGDNLAVLRESIATLTDPRFQSPEKAREWLEMQRWTNGPYCSHCGSFSVTGLSGKAHRPGVYQCNDCRQQCTVTTGSVMERSKIPLNKWLMAMHLMASSKKGSPPT